MSDTEVEKLINKYGGEILGSEEFAAARAERHHLKTSIAAHSLRVARTSLKIADRVDPEGKKLNRRVLVVGALCHDLGLIDRDEKYRWSIERLSRHPMESERIALKLMPQMDKKTRMVIRRHMFPLIPLPPQSGEGAAVILADKVVSIKEIFGVYRKKGRLL